MAGNNGETLLGAEDKGQTQIPFPGVQIISLYLDSYSSNYQQQHQDLTEQR